MNIQNGAFSRPSVWQRSPERVAWAVLFISFTLCVTLAVVVPLGMRAFLLHAPRRLPVMAQSLRGTALLEVPGQAALAALTERIELRPGTTLRTDDTASVSLVIYQGENGPQTRAEAVSVLAYNNTEVRLEGATFPRFPQWSPDPASLALYVEQGRVRVVTGRLNRRPVRVYVTTPYGTVHAQEASFSVFVNTRGMEVTVRQGEARVASHGLEVPVPEGQRTTVPVAQPPQRPMPAERNLVRNGNFTEPLELAWSVGTQQPPEVTAGTVSRVDVAGRRAVRFSRRAEDGVHTEVWIEQNLNQDVRDVDSLVLRMDVRLFYQSLSGGGYLGSEYPLMVRLDYTDVYGKDLFWVHGFYFRDPEDRRWPTTNGEKIPPFVWYPYESPNLIATLDQAGTRPAVLRRIRIYASGHNYQSMVAEVGLLAR